MKVYLCKHSSNRYFFAECGNDSLFLHRDVVKITKIEGCVVQKKSTYFHTHKAYRIQWYEFAKQNLSKQTAAVAKLLHFPS